MASYYNEIDAAKAEWLRENIKANLIAPGEVDERSIADVQPEDLRGFTQCHFFAGIGIWSYALRLAGWPDSRPVWTGSCPCQPFSVSGKREGFDDERHLWPEWIRLIQQCRPTVIIGEQVGAACRGAAFKDEDLPSLQARAALLGVLRQLEGAAPRNLQGMRQDGRTDQEADRSRTDRGTVPGLAKPQKGSRANERGAVSGEEEGLALHDRQGRDSGPDRAWLLRNHGNTVRSYQASLLECAVSGPDQSDGWIHAREHARGSLCLECDGERLGHEQSSGDGQRDPRAAYKAQRRIQRIFDRCFEEALGESWLDLIHDDLEAEGYTIGPCVFGACSVGAPHIRQRLYFGAYAADARRDDSREHGSGSSLLSARDGGRSDFPLGQAQGRTADGRDCATGLDSDPTGERRGEAREPVGGRKERAGEPGELGDTAERGSGTFDGQSETCNGQEIAAGRSGLSAMRDHALGPRLEGHLRHERDGRGPGWLDQESRRSASAAGATRGFWANCDWWYGRDGKYRPIEPGLSPLAHGAAARVLRLRGYGDGIVAPQAAEFIKAWSEEIVEKGHQG